MTTSIKAKLKRTLTLKVNFKNLHFYRIYGNDECIRYERSYSIYSPEGVILSVTIGGKYKFIVFSLKISVKVNFFQVQIQPKKKEYKE